MTMTAKQLCEEVYGLSGFSTTGAGFANAQDQDDRLIFYLLRQAIREVGKYKWQELVKTSTIAIDGMQTEYALPADFREFIPGSVRVVDNINRVDFPADFRIWAMVDSNIGPTGIVHRIQLRQNKLTVLAQDSDAYTLRFEYISDHPVTDSTGLTGKRTVDADDDIVLLDEDLMVKALKAKWSIEKSLDTLQADLAAFDHYLNLMRGTHAHSKTLNFAAPRFYRPGPPYTDTWI